MEVGSKALRDVEFRQQLRGYHQDDVDQFLEEVATGIEALQDRLREANDRAAVAGRARPNEVDGEETVELGRQRPSASPSGEDPDEEVRRTLELAHRTMTLAIGEAREEARRLVADAESKAADILNAAETVADRKLIEGRNQLRDEVSRLTAVRAELTGAVAGLEDQVEQGRRRAREALVRALDLLEVDEFGRRDSDNLARDLPDDEAMPIEDPEVYQPGSAQPDLEQPVRPEPELEQQPAQDLRGRVRFGTGARRAPLPTEPAGNNSVQRGGPAQAEPGSVADDRDEPDATRLLRLRPPGPVRNRVYDAEQTDS